MERYPSTSDTGSWTELIASSLQIRRATLRSDLVSSLSSLGRRTSDSVFCSPAEQIRGLGNALARIYAFYAQYTPKMANVDMGGQYKRIMRFFWDPEPENDDPQAAPIWCLGQMYLSDGLARSSPDTRELPIDSSTSRDDDADRDTVFISRPPAASRMSQSLTESDRHFSLINRTDANENGWPELFLQDFESCFWFTYRSSFPAIRKSEDPRASSSLSLGVRLRSQLVDQNGFTADTGWGCMIRSGQCVLANALALRVLGRGETGRAVPTERADLSKSGEEAKTPRKSDALSPSLQMIPELPIPSTDSCSTGKQHAENIPESGLALPLLQGA
jgi:Peptidase family C54